MFLSSGSKKVEDRGKGKEKSPFSVTMRVGGDSSGCTLDSSRKKVILVVVSLLSERQKGGGKMGKSFGVDGFLAQARSSPSGGLTRSQRL